MYITHVSILPLLLSLAGASAPAASITYTVDSDADAPDDDVGDGICHTAAGTCTLRAAVMQAAGKGITPVDILVPAGHYTLTRPILGDDDGSEGDLNITGTTPITIQGQGVDMTTIDAAARDRVLHVEAGAQLTLSSVTLTGGNATHGGGVWNEGTLNLQSSAVVGNIASGGGGGIHNDVSGLTYIYYVTLTGGTATQGGGLWNSGSAIVYSSNFLENNVSDEGGGIENDTSGSTYLADVLIAHNSALGAGGISNRHDLSIDASTIDANTAGDVGGGIVVWSGSLQMSGSTVSNNTGRRGGGLYAVDSISLVNVTFAGNNASAEGGALYTALGSEGHLGQGYSLTFVDNRTDDSGATEGHLGAAMYVATGSMFALTNSLFARNVASNSTADDCDGDLIDLHGNNLFGTVDLGCTYLQSDSGGPFASDDYSQIGPLADNGGHVKTVALLYGSPAIDLGYGGGCTDPSGHPLQYDARDFPRPFGAACDVGAYEFNDTLFTDGFESR